MTWLGLERRTWMALTLAGGAWVGAVAGRWWGTAGLAGLAAIAVVTAMIGRRLRSRVALVGFLALVGWWSGFFAAQREQAILEYPTPPGTVHLKVRLLGDPRAGEHGWWALSVADPPEAGRPESVPMLLAFDAPPPGQAGERLRIEGRRTDRTGHARGNPYSGVVQVDQVARVEPDGATWWTAGNMVRARALERLRDRGPERALLAGFLVGDTTGVPAADMEAMRRTGLTHLVAVSGSNVSLFLTLTLVAAGPLASGPRRRAVAGLIALMVLVVATRWEPSVVRASTMAGLMLAGRVGGWALDPATALAVTVIGVVAVSGELATDVGFALSALATLGVLLGAGLQPVSLPRPVATVLGATVGAQLAVAPLLLTVFGTIPLLSPLTNLVAVPVVAATTATGAVAVAVGAEPLIELSARGAGLVLFVARTGAAWPQVAWGGLALLAAAAALTLFPRLRSLLAIGLAAAVAAVLLAGPASLPSPGAVVLDVGQGDAILVASSAGRRMLVDGGPDPARLEEKLLRYGVTRLDLVVLTHVHADHAAGLEAVLGRRAVGEVWLPTPPHETTASRTIRRLVGELGLVARPPPVGRVVPLGDLAIEVLGPRRRYASPNDQSIVMRISAPGGPRLLLTGDVETHAQQDLTGLQADILKVPHQGAATSDLGWLEGVGADWAIISVGPNDFGHPAPEVVATLEKFRARVSRTDRDGDVVIRLGGHID